jgi:hypothetical protein
VKNVKALTLAEHRTKDDEVIIPSHAELRG